MKVLQSFATWSMVPDSTVERGLDLVNNIELKILTTLTSVKMLFTFLDYMQSQAKYHLLLH